MGVKKRWDDVKRLQGLLRRAGFEAGAPDGAYGAATVTAVKTLQQASGIAANGNFGQQTRKALATRLAMAEKASVREPSLERRLQVLATLGNLLRGTKKFDEAEESFQNALRLDPNSAQVQRYYATHLQLWGKR